MAMPHQPSTDSRNSVGARPNRLAFAFHTPGFPVLCGATLSGQIGVGMQQVLLGWLVLSMTDSSSMVGVLFAVRSAPNLLMGFAAGAITDRHDRRMLMRLTGCGMVLVSWLIAWLWWMGSLHIWQLLLCAGLFGLLHAFETTARQAYTCDVVGVSGAVQSLALLSLVQRLGGVLGSLLAGVTLQWWGTGVACVVMGMSYSGGVAALWALRHRGTAAPRVQESMWQNVMAYGHELRTNRVMQSLMLSTAGAELLGFSHQVLLPTLAKDVLHSGATGLGMLTAARFLGGVLGSGLLTAVQPARHRGALLLAALVLFGSGQVVLAHAPSFWLAVVCVIFISIMAAATDILHMALLQHSVANEQRGRAMGAWVVGCGVAPVGHVEIGYLAAIAGARLALLLNGLGLIVLAGVFALCLPRLRRL
jgi:MFS family permease